MSRELSIEAVVQAVEAAFRPLRCVVELFDYQHRIRFRIFDKDEKPLLTMEEALVRRMQDPGGLNTIVSECRSRLERKGMKLDAWSVPKVADRES